VNSALVGKPIISQNPSINNTTAKELATRYRNSTFIYKKAVPVHRTPREAKAMYPSDWIRKFNWSL